MKAGFFYGLKDIRVANIDIPDIGDDEVLVRVKTCGICGTDIHIYNGAEGSAQVTPPVILGHEFSGDVQRVGKNVQNVQVGDRISVDPNIPCGSCRYCQTGKIHLCNRLRAIGVTQNGGFAEYCAVPGSQAFQIDKAMSYLEGAFVEPVACCVHGIDLAGIKSGATVLIIGGGTIGLIMLQLAKLAGASRLILIEPVAAKRERAKILGADITVDPNDPDAIAALSAQTGGGADVSIECVGRSQTIELAVQNTAKGGTVLIFGVADPQLKVGISPFEFFQKELTLKTSFVNPFTHRRAIEIIASGKIDLNCLVHRTFPLEQLAQAFSMPELFTQGKIMIELG